MALDSTSFVITFPIQKVDKDKREVIGIATSEVLDVHGEILTYDGSKDALKTWAGNVREMHQPKAVGRKVSMEFDDANKAITVRSRVSKGAEDTWQKVLDGTLAMYSVGGTRIDTQIKSSKEVPQAALKGVTEVPEEIRVTTKWKMGELSLVDAGANPMTSISLVKDIDGTPVETEAVTDPEVEVPKTKQSFPKSSFAFVDKDGVGHYPIKNRSGSVDAELVRSALARIFKAIEKGEDEAAMALKAMPKARAAAKKLAINSFRSEPAFFLVLHDVRKIKLEDGTEYEDEKCIDRETLLAAAEMMKYAGGYATEFNYTPVTFAVAYDRYQRDEAMDEIYDLLQIFDSCLCAIAFDTELSDADKKSMVAESVSDFVSIFTGAALDVAAKVDLEADLRKRIEEIIMGVEANKDNKEPVLNADAVAKMLQHALSAETLGSAIAKSLQPMVDNQAKLEKTVTESLKNITDRLDKVEKTPAVVDPTKVPVLKVVDRNGVTAPFRPNSGGNSGGNSMSSRVNAETNELILEENGVEYTLVSVQKDIADIEKVLESQPANDPTRLRNEVRAIALHRIRKILTGDKVWR